ncbi:MAG TPA: response regulator transcription factor [bacterium]|nr:response regulator transcription factor [bacterium]
MSITGRTGYRILIIEDNSDIAANMGDYLQDLGHSIDFAWDGISGMHLALTHDYDAIILDVMLPGMDGLTLCRNLRNTDPPNRTPVLMLTARDTLDDKLSGFDAGTDDYLVKPFALQELLARIRALVTRHTVSGETILQIGDLKLCKGPMIVERAGHRIHLNRACLRILMCLMDASPNVVTRQELETLLWGDEPPDSDALRSHIYQLRSRIDKPFKTPLIHTVHGIGFQIKLPDDL